MYLSVFFFTVCYLYIVRLLVVLCTLWVQEESIITGLLPETRPPQAPATATLPETPAFSTETANKIVKIFANCKMLLIV